MLSRLGAVLIYQVQTNTTEPHKKSKMVSNLPQRVHQVYVIAVRPQKDYCETVLFRINVKLANAKATMLRLEIS